MAKSSNLLLYLSVFIFIITKLALAQTCSNYKFSSENLFESCNDLHVLDSFIHYTYNSSSGNLQVAYRHTDLTSKKWVAWAVNPTSTGMVGAQAIVAYPQPDGSVRAYTSPVSSYQTSLQEGDLSFNVSELSATYQNNEMIIFATLSLPVSNGGNINTVWQDGSLSGTSLLSHPTSGKNIRSVSTLNLLSAASGGGGAGAGAGDSKLGLQVSSWAGNQPGFSLALTVLSVFALFLRPKPEHKYRVYGNIYHHTIGYTVIILAVVNVFKGLDILSPEKQWRNAYTAIVRTLGLVSCCYARSLYLVRRLSLETMVGLNRA
ncbi:unnamed protein product [Brassica oleracea]|uniref:DOMON domain-containing protein n=1 Tax=Brassica oleracea var. oleracea TaxID=109376 RepID=A0A0D3E792_BRAOL|nr:PREDICTED: cytochrome b561 and DOMON domain-containing protein At5g47530-like [Brassica oleracea var. oleracea]